MDRDPERSAGLEPLAALEAADIDELPTTDPSTLFDVLANDRRQHALVVILERDSSISLSDLTDAVVERIDSGPRVSDADRERVLIELHHTHLPKLADVGFVSYDSVRREVTTTAAVEPLESYFER